MGQVTTRTPRDYRWAHAVNTRELLDEVASELRRAHAGGFATADFVNAIEADVIWSERQRVPVMGHPPETDGDLTLEEFLRVMADLAKLFPKSGSSHADVGGWTTPLIVKLDFKSTKAFQTAYDIQRRFIAQFPFARGIFINADILVGPANTDHVAFDATEFLQGASALGSIDGPNTHKIVLSVGWTTSNATDEEMYRPYSLTMVEEMLEALKPYRHLQVTFPLRATSCRASWDAIQRLLVGHKTYGFTLWWAKTQMSDDEIEWLYRTLEETEDGTGQRPFANRTFYDIKGFEDFLARRGQN